MEEKERYEIHMYDDVCVDLYDNGVLDKSINDTYKLEELLNQQDKRIKELENQLAESEKNIEHYHKLYNERDKQFQSVRQRYHLLNKLQSNYDKKDKLHLAYMQCKELVDENEQLKQQLHDLPKKIVKEIKKELYDCGRTYLEDEPYIEICIVKGILDTILKKYGDKQ